MKSAASVFGMLFVLANCLSMGQHHASADLVLPPGWIDYTGASSIAPTGTDRWHVPIGFDFSFYGPGNLVTSDAYVQSNGYLGVGPEMVNNIPIWEAGNWPYGSYEQNFSRMISPLGAPYNYLWPREGEIYYQTVGTLGQQVFAATWDVYLDQPKTQHAIFQAQLHEATGRIQFSYAQIPDELTGACVGLNYGAALEHTSFYYDGEANFDGGGTQPANQYGPPGNLTGWSIYYDCDEDACQFEVSQAQTPEPSTIVQLLTGLGGGWIARRRQKRTA